MVLRLCIIGNSHIAAIKLGWEQVVSESPADWQDIAPVFFGAPQDSLRHLRLEAGSLVSRKKDVTDHFVRMSGGRDRITLGDYDAFLLVGLSVSSKRILRFYRAHAWVGQGGVAGKTLVHPGFAAEFMAERYADTRMVSMAALIAGAVDKPIIAIAEPHWATWAREGKEGVANYGWDAAIQAGDGPGIGAVFRQAIAAALQPHAIFVPQPDETVEDGILTRAAFNKDASRLITGEGGGTDASHMNAAYGAALWPGVRTALLGARQ
jgi:hypothetical protein